MKRELLLLVGLAGVMMPTKAQDVVRADASVRIGMCERKSTNLVANPDLSEDDGLGRIVGWKKNIRDEKTTAIDARTIGGGAFSVHAHGTGWADWLQDRIGLVSNAQYRLSYEVRTTGLRGVKAQFYLCDGKWSRKSAQKGDAFPDDTKGVWVRQEKTLVSQAGEGPEGHVLVLSCLSGKPEGEIGFEIRNLRLEAVDSRVAAKSTPRVCVRNVRARIVPVDPLLASVDPANGRMRFYWPGFAACGRTNCTLSARLDGGASASSSLDANGYATVVLGKMKPGPHAVAVEMCDPAGKRLAADDYRIVAKRPSLEKQVGRRLNNFVTELVNRPLANGVVEFTRAKAGWTWITFGEVGTDDADVRGYLDDWAHPVVYRREGEVHLETQRWLSEGVHTLRVVGAKPGRTLRVHAVPVIWGAAPFNLTTNRFDVNGIFKYTLPFSRRFSLISTFNTLSKVDKYLNGSDDTGAGFYYERGVALAGTVDLGPNAPDRESFEATLKSLKSGSWRLGRTVNVNENQTVSESLPAVNFSEAVWSLFKEDPAHRVNVWYWDSSMGRYHKTPEINVSEISAIVNTGNGTGLLVPELYAPVLETRESLWKYIDCAANFVQSAERLVPAAKGATLLYGAGYIDIFDWSNYVCPATDIKAHYAEMIRVFATDPRFAGCAGVGFGGGICCEEEFRRWGAKVVRHYALEGAADDLADAYGFAWTPGFVKDPDFENGFTNWTCREAEIGALRAERIAAYGSKIQKRRGGGHGYGDTAALFKASEKGASEVEQRLKGLVPGQYYALHFSVADKATMWLPKSRRPTVAPPRYFSARLDGADEVRGLTYEHLRSGKRNYRYVFKARAPEATLVLTDAANGKLNEPGTELVLNYIVFRPYYVEDDAEVRQIVETLGWNGI